MRVYSKPDHNIAYIEGVIEAFTGSLVASLSGNKVSIYHTGLGQYQVQGVDFSVIKDQNNGGFASAADTLNYLNSIFVVQQNAGLTIYFTTPLTQWILNHNLGYFPNVNLYTMGGAEIDADILNVSKNQVIVTFNTPTAGFARIF